MYEHCKAISDYRGRVSSYLLRSVLRIVLLGVLGGAQRGRKDLASFAKGLNRG